jgi:predicted metal-binding protein
MDEELKLFKAIVRQIMRHEAGPREAKWFLVEGRARLRRLAKLGATGHQPAFAAYCKTNLEEKQAVTEAILGQKVGANVKAMKNYTEFRQRAREAEQPSRDTILVKLARIAFGAAPRWKRIVQMGPANHDGAPGGGTEPEDEDKINYSTRMIACTRCGSRQETRWMQLRTREGFRAVHCRACGRQERTASNTCQCELVWHQCPTHRIDPAVHMSKKGAKREAAEITETNQKKQNR